MLKTGPVITQDDINAKLFESLEKLDERMDKFDAKVTAQMNWQLAMFTVIMVGALVKLITT